MHIDTFLNRVETHFPPNLSNVDKVNMLISQIVEGPTTGNICRNGWIGSYADLRRWLVQTYRDIIPEVSVSDWATVTRNRGVSFKLWQAQNIRIIDHTWSHWNAFTDSERIMVMRGLERIVPKPALMKWTLGSSYDSVKLRNTSFPDILREINEHYSAWFDVCWGTFDAKLTVGRVQDTRTLNIQKENQGRGRQRKRAQQNHTGDAETSSTPSPPTTPPQDNNRTSSNRTQNPSSQRQRLPHDPNAFCDNHGIFGHSTAQCRYPNGPSRRRNRPQHNTNQNSRSQQPAGSAPATHSSSGSSSDANTQRRYPSGRGQGRRSQSRGGRGGRQNGSGRGGTYNQGYNRNYNPAQVNTLMNQLPPHLQQYPFPYVIQHPSQPAVTQQPQQQPPQQGAQGNAPPPASFGLGIINSRPS